MDKLIHGNFDRLLSNRSFVVQLFYEQKRNFLMFNSDKINIITVKFSINCLLESWFNSA